MTKKVCWTFVLAVAIVAPLVAVAATGDIDLKKIKCPISGQPVKENATAEHNKATVYFCCGKCPAAFEKNVEKFAAKANHQIFATKQVKQVNCPKSGQPINEETEIEVDGVKVAFCCNNCKTWALDLPEPEQVEKIFSKESFKKGFELVEKEDES